MISFEWYRTFIAIYQEGNLTKAAQELSISQPNVSVQLASLEQYVGGQLFERMPRKMIPTELGKRLYTQVVGSVENLSTVEKTFTKKSLHRLPSIKLGSPLEFFYTKITPRLPLISSPLHVSFGIATDLIRQLIDGELDFVIASQKATESKNIVYEPILQENFIIIGNLSLHIDEFHHHIKLKEYHKAEKWLIDHEWYAYSNDLAFIRRFWLKNFNKRPMISPKYIIPNLNVIIKSVAESNTGISVVSDFLAKEFLQRGKIKIVWEGLENASNTLYIAYDKSKVNSEKIDEIKKLFTND